MAYSRVSDVLREADEVGRMCEVGTCDCHGGHVASKCDTFPRRSLKHLQLNSYFIKWKWAARQIKEHNESVEQRWKYRRAASRCELKALALTVIKQPVYLGHTTASCLHLIFVCCLFSPPCIISSPALSLSLSGKSVMLESCQWVLRPVASWGARLAG